jgi:hypothetical protein
MANTDSRPTWPLERPGQGAAASAVRRRPRNGLLFQTYPRPLADEPSLIDMGSALAGNPLAREREAIPLVSQSPRGNTRPVGNRRPTAQPRQLTYATTAPEWRPLRLAGLIGKMAPLSHRSSYGRDGGLTEFRQVVAMRLRDPVVAGFDFNLRPTSLPHIGDQPLGPLVRQLCRHLSLPLSVVDRSPSLSHRCQGSMSRLRRNLALFLVGLGEVIKDAGVTLISDGHPAYSSNEELDHQVSCTAGGSVTVRTRSECE